MPDVEHNYILLVLEDAKDYAINVRFVPEEQMSEFAVLMCYRATIGIVFWSANGSPKLKMPPLGGNGALSTDIRVDQPEVAFGARQDTNLIFHAPLQIL